MVKTKKKRGQLVGRVFLLLKNIHSEKRVNINVSTNNKKYFKLIC